ncbi:MAG: hydrolase, partial [Acidimicrobiaceae bacterium]|nr:hydrolase [Acidimicrobiaceae bacterium]
MVGNASPASATGTTFTAPLIPGSSADPSVAYYNGYYYMLYNQGISSRVTMRAATSLAGLGSAPNITVYTADSSTPCCDIGFGGFLYHASGHWYIYDNGDNGDVNNSLQFVLESSGDDPLGPYHFKASFTNAPGPNDSGYALNPFSVGGQLYATSTSIGGGSNNSIYIATMSNPWTLSSSWTLIAAPASSGWECAGGSCIDEGGSAVVHGGRIFLLFSAGSFASPDYCVGMLNASTTADLTQAGSWTKSPACVFSRNDAAGAYGPGSMTWFTSPDGTQDWVAYHLKTSSSFDTSGTDRRITAEQVTWDSSGSPVFGSPVALGTSITLPSGDAGPSLNGTYEAENGVVTDAHIWDTASASNGAYVGGIDYSDSSVAFNQVDVPTSGTYAVKVFFDNGWSATAT